MQVEIVSVIKKILLSGESFYPAICQAVRPLSQTSAEVKKLGGRRTARKRPLGEG